MTLYIQLKAICLMAQKLAFVHFLQMILKMMKKQLNQRVPLSISSALIVKSS
uniref:Uncharacterized protein n=1 Tax=Yersinia enterocolitica TaxID=630 RepID=B0RKX4_YEREN|nr:hypothetical protein [Yersinia enterocolitica]